MEAIGFAAWRVLKKARHAALLNTQRHGKDAEIAKANRLSAALAAASVDPLETRSRTQSRARKTPS